VPDRPLESYDRLLLALDQLQHEARRADGAGRRERASLAMLDAIDFAEVLGMLWGDGAGRWRAVVKEAFGDVDRQKPGDQIAADGSPG
jgi:hypothetical protein